MQRNMVFMRAIERGDEFLILAASTGDGFDIVIV
jgi:hypothetical protein